MPAAPDHRPGCVHGIDGLGHPCSRGGEAGWCRPVRELTSRRLAATTTAFCSTGAQMHVPPDLSPADWKLQSLRVSRIDYHDPPDPPALR